MSELLTLADWVIKLEKEHPECEGVNVTYDRIIGVKQLGGLINNNGQDFFFSCAGSGAIATSEKIPDSDLQHINVSGSNPDKTLTGHGLGLLYIPIISDVANFFFESVVKTLDGLGNILGIPDLGKKFEDWWNKFIKWLEDFLGKAIIGFWILLGLIVIILIYKAYKIFSEVIK